LIDIDWEFVAVGAPAFLSLGVLAGLGARPRVRRPAVAVAVAVAVATLGALYSLTAPYASGRLVDSAYNAIADGKISNALGDGRSARWLNPLSVDPLMALGDAEAARGDEAAAVRRYRQAVDLQPENSSTWYALGSYELFTGRYRAALHDLDRAYGLDPYGPAGRHGGLLDQARAKVEGR
jgi:Flp pilus assembly protein TadD